MGKLLVVVFFVAHAFGQLPPPPRHCTMSACSAELSCCPGFLCTEGMCVGAGAAKSHPIDLAGKCPRCKPGHVCVEGSCQPVKAVAKALAAVPKDQCTYGTCHINTVGCCAGYWCEVQWAGYGSCMPDEPTPSTTEPIPSTDVPVPTDTESPSQCTTGSCLVGKVGCCPGYWCKVQWAGYGACVTDVPTPSTDVPTPTAQCSTGHCSVTEPFVGCCEGYACHTDSGTGAGFCQPRDEPAAVVEELVGCSTGTCSAYSGCCPGYSCHTDSGTGFGFCEPIQSATDDSAGRCSTGHCSVTEPFVGCCEGYACHTDSGTGAGFCQKRLE